MDKQIVNSIADKLASRASLVNLNRMTEDLNVLESLLSDYKEDLNSKNNETTLKKYLKKIYESSLEIEKAVYLQSFKTESRIFSVRFTAAKTVLFDEPSATDFAALGIVSILTGMAGNMPERHKILNYLCGVYDIEQFWVQTSKKESPWNRFWAVSASKVIEIVETARNK